VLTPLLPAPLNDAGAGGAGAGGGAGVEEIPLTTLMVLDCRGEAVFVVAEEEVVDMLLRGLAFLAELLGALGGRAVDGRRVDLRFCFFSGSAPGVRVHDEMM
jgi:hypothetical protein